MEMLEVMQVVLDTSRTVTKLKSRLACMFCVPEYDPYEVLICCSSTERHGCKKLCLVVYEHGERFRFLYSMVVLLKAEFFQFLLCFSLLGIH